MSLEIIQGSDEWKAIRLGKVTASRVADVIGRTKTGWGAGRTNYMSELIVERLTGVAAEGFTNAAMQWGTDKEPDARDAYEYFADVSVAQVGFVPHPTIAMSGASPDGLIAADGMLEIKCPNTATHIETLLSGTVAGKYVTQMQWQMACSGRRWCDFVSFDPRLPEEMRLFIKRVPRDPAFIHETEEAVMAFLRELDGKVESLEAKFRRIAA
jgi:putative phage-type endonuclease